MATTVITVQITGAADEEDRRAWRHIVGLENARRAALNPPVAPLPSSTAAELRSSYELLLQPTIVAMHRSYIEQSDIATLQQVRERWPIATDAQRNAALAALGG